MDSRATEGISFLQDQNINLSVNKSELVRKVADIIATDDLENELEVLSVQSVEYSMPPTFNNLSVAIE